MYHCRVLMALISSVLLLLGISMQVFSASNLYGVPLHTMCKSYSGSPEVSDTTSFTALITKVLEQREECLTKPSQQEILECCKSHSPSEDSWYFSGICAKPWLSGFSLKNDTGLNLGESLDLFTSVLSDFIGVAHSNEYANANAEFWCKNCPNDYRKNCPFDPPDDDVAMPGMQSSGLCECPGGKLSTKDEHFWSSSADSSLSGRYILCSDQAKVYRSWIEALFPRSAQPEWTSAHYEAAEQRFYNTCFSRKGQLGFILTVGPVLGVFSCIFTIFSLFKYCATTGLPSMTYNFVLLAISMTLISFWPLSFTGAAGLIARYSFCWGLQDTVVVLNATYGAQGRAAPVLFTGQPCYDINSAGDHETNPFIEQLGVFNAGYVTGGVLMIIALILMLAIVSKHSDVVLESKLARPDARGSEEDQL
mmetsp:Transcript_24110/g.20265  ORF Transcript_24110/g.20265 Transcript_24110/m.20265 type:complete len:421 (-) Transcript_24110:164-1426(-)